MGLEMPTITECAREGIQILIRDLIGLNIPRNMRMLCPWVAVPLSARPESFESGLERTGQSSRDPVCAGHHRASSRDRRLASGAPALDLAVDERAGSSGTDPDQW
jgi:hypothetical protein